MNAVQKVADDRGISFFSALDDGVNEGLFGKPGERLRSFRNMIEDLKESAPQITLHELMEEVLEKSGYRKELEHKNSLLLGMIRTS